MSFDFDKINLADIPMDAVRVELAREEQVRMTAYPKLAEAKKYSVEKLYSQLGAIIKARRTIEWLVQQDLEFLKKVAPLKERVRVAFLLMTIAEKNPDDLLAVAKVIKAFPGATFGVISEHVTKALEAKEKAA